MQIIQFLCNNSYAVHLISRADRWRRRRGANSGGVAPPWRDPPRAGRAGPGGAAIAANRSSLNFKARLISVLLRCLTTVRRLRGSRISYENLVICMDILCSRLSVSFTDTEIMSNIIFFQNVV
jgi:hypothetical protein